MVRGVYPPYTLSGPTTKKTLFIYLCLPLGVNHIICIEIEIVNKERGKAEYTVIVNKKKGYFH